MKIIKYTCLLVLPLLVVISTQYGWVFFSKNYKPHQQQIEKLKPLADELKSHVVYLSETCGNRDIFNDYDNLNKAADYISQELNSYGYEVQYQEYKVSGKVVKNIYVIKQSSKPDTETLIIGAHYDTYSNPGADDNASAVAGNLALAKRLSNVETDSNLNFVFFVNEEPPFFHSQAMGSVVYAKALKAQGTKVKGAIILEMIGYYSQDWFSQKYPVLIGPFFPNKGNFIAFVSNFDSNTFLKDIKNKFIKRSNFPMRTLVAPSFVNGVDFSDHWSFWQEGYPAIMITDTAFMRNKNYHQPTDTPQTLNYQAMSEIIKALSKTISDK